MKAYIEDVEFLGDLVKRREMFQIMIPKAFGAGWESAVYRTDYYRLDPDMEDLVGWCHSGGRLQIGLVVAMTKDYWVVKAIPRSHDNNTGYHQNLLNKHIYVIFRNCD